MAQMVERLLSIHELSRLSQVRFPVFPTYWDCMDIYSCLLDLAIQQFTQPNVRASVHEG